jgi:hypothetical protein
MEPWTWTGEPVTKIADSLTQEEKKELVAVYYDKIVAGTYTNIPTMVKTVLKRCGFIEGQHKLAKEQAKDHLADLILLIDEWS